MKSKRLTLLVFTLVVTMSATVFAATNPFADVPADHWAYDSIIKLAAVGLIEGYPDGTYGGSRMLTRYEAAMVFARTLARLEALVESGVVEKTAGVQAAITADVMAEIEKAKAELADLVKAEVAKLGVGVVPGKSEETGAPLFTAPGVLSPEAEAAIAKLVAEQTKNQLAEAKALAEEAIAKTNALEAVVQGLDVITEDEVKAIVENILAESVNDRLDKVIYDNSFLTRRVDNLGRAIDRRVSDVEKLQAQTANDVLALQEKAKETDALIQAIQGDYTALSVKVEDVADSIATLAQEFKSELALLGIRVDELEMLYAKLDGRVNELADGLAAVDSRVDKLADDYAALKAATERVQISGSSSATASNVSIFDDNDPDRDTYVLLLDDTEYVKGPEITQEFDLKLSVKAAEDVTVNLTAAFEADVFKPDFKLTTAGFELLTNSPVYRVYAGTLDSDEVYDRFNAYALNLEPEYGVLTDIDLLGIDVNTLFGRDENAEYVLGLTGKYVLGSALGVEAGANLLVEDKNNFDGPYVLYGSLFGEVWGVDYTGTLVLDQYQDDAEENSLFELALSTEVKKVDVDAVWAKAGANYGQGVLADGGFFTNADTRLELGASTELFGFLDVKAQYYNEKAGDTENVKAWMVSLYEDFDSFLPFVISGKIGKMNDDEHREFTLGIPNMMVFNSKPNLLFGGSFSVIKNWIDTTDDEEDWRDPSAWKIGRDANVLGLELDYAFDVKGADFNVGYDFEYIMPRGDFKNLYGNQAAHRLNADYSLTESMKLKLSALRAKALDPADNAVDVQEIKAGFEFSF